MNKECIHISGSLSAYSDKELSEEKHREVERHLKTCPECGMKLAELEDTETLLKTVLSCNEANMDFSGIWKKIESNTKFRPSLWKRIIRAVGKPVVWMPAVFAGTAACMLICFLPDFFSGQGRQAPTQTSRVESVYSSTGQVMVMQTAKSCSPLIWILPESNKEAG